MESETPTPFWKRLTPNPSGALPGGILTQVGVGLTSVLVAAMLITHQCGGGEPPPAATGSDQAPVAGGAGLDRNLAGKTQQQRRQLEREEATAARRQQIQQQEVLAAGLGGGQVSRAQGGGPPGVAGQAIPGSPPGQQPQTEAEFLLRQQLRLEEIERKRRSLRVGPVVLTHRTASAVQEERETEAAAAPAAAARPAVVDPTAAMLAALDTFAAVEAHPAAGEAPPAPPPAVPAPEPASGYDDPTRITEPFDPPGTERIYEGSFLEAVLVTQLSGEFTGPVLAMVALPFYSTDRQRILVPRGTRAVGTAQAVGGGDQERLAVGFHRLVFPDGRWVALKFDGLDQAGDAALKDKVNRHYLSMFAAVGAVGVLSGLTLRGSNPYAGGQAGVRAGAGQAIGQAGMQILSRFLNRYPTITIRAGHRLRIWFTSDVLVPRPPPH